MTRHTSPTLSETIQSARFLPGVLERLTSDLLRQYPRKTFGVLYARSDSTAVADYYIYRDDDRARDDVTKAFEDRGEYYRNNSNAGFKATVAETISENANCKKRGYKRVAIFHTHLRHPVYFDEVDLDLHPTADLWHLLVSLRNPMQPELAAFKVTSLSAERIPIEGASTKIIEVPDPLPSPRLLDDVEFVEVGGGLHVSRTLITAEQYYRVLAYDEVSPHGNLPIVNVSWRDAVVFCIITGTRLLTSFEWDALCDDAVAHRRTGLRAPELSEFAVFGETPGNKLRSVASKKPNKFGLYDMLGNAWEWCDSTDRNSAPTKGGSYYAFAKMCQSGVSVSLPKDYRARDLGFRVCYGVSS